MVEDEGPSLEDDGPSPEEGRSIAGKWNGHCWKMKAAAFPQDEHLLAGAG